MEIISDLTRDTRPTLKNILISSIHDTVELDRKRDLSDVKHIQHENDSFYYRVLHLFTQRALLYYKIKEVEEWSRENIMGEVSLPDFDKKG